MESLLYAFVMIFCKLIVDVLTEGGVDPKSPIGIAAAFSKPNKQAFLMANTSILFEYASREILNNIGSKYVNLKFAHLGYLDNYVP